VQGEGGEGVAHGVESDLLEPGLVR
jgi:hypothetical protein